jgi:hypothetical protein
MRVNFFNHDDGRSGQAGLMYASRHGAGEDKKRLARTFAVKKAVCRWGVPGAQRNR